MRALLHIGTEKTGTTSIQRFLRTNRQVLRRQGFATSRELGGKSQVALAVAALPDEPRRRLHRRLGLGTTEDVQAFRHDRRQALARELAGKDGSLLLSCEQLSTLPTSETSVRRLVSWLGDLVDEVQAVVYLRRQDSLLLASYSQSLKLGRTEPLTIPDESVAGPGSKYDYWALVSRWATVLGKHSVQVRVFEPEMLVEGDVVKDYMQVVGITPGPELSLPDRRNPSLDAEGAEFLRLINQHLPAKTDGPDPLRGDVSPAVTLAAHSGPSLTLDPATARHFVSRFEAGNAEIARQFLGWTDSPLFRQDYRHLDEPFAGLTVERAVEISAWLWTEQQRKHLLEQRTANDTSRA